MGPHQVRPSAISCAGSESLSSFRYSAPTAKPIEPPGSCRNEPKLPDNEPEATCWVTVVWLTLSMFTQSAAA